MVDWTHIQVLDYEQLPFKCRHCHGYGHFAKHCKKKSEDGAEKEKGDQWTQIQKSGTTKQSNRNKGKALSTGRGAPPEAQAEGSSVPSRADIPTNPFEILSTLEKLQDPADKEDEQQANNMEENKRQEETVPLQSKTPKVASSSPTYADMTRKKTPEISGSSEDETAERPSKRVGRKTHKEAREEEVERQKNAR